MMDRLELEARKAAGRREGTQANKLRADEMKATWKALALRLMGQHPSWRLERIACEVHEACELGFANGRRYAFATVWKFLDDAFGIRVRRRKSKASAKPYSLTSGEVRE